MHGIFDKLAKLVTRTGVAPACTSASEHEVHHDAQRADLLVEPDPVLLALLLPLGFLGRICRRTCTVEFFHTTPGVCRVEACIVKILVFRRERRRERRTQRRPENGRRTRLRPLPVQWLVISGRPNDALTAFGFKREARWGPGVYRGPRGLATRVVVASELPVTRDTLLVRFIAGKDGVQERARKELLALPAGAPERRIAEPIMLKLWPHMDVKRARRSRETEEFRAMFQPVVDQHDEEKRREGMVRGMVRSLLDVYEARFGPAPETIAAAAAAVHDPDLLRGWLRLVVTGTATEVAAALHPPVSARKRPPAPARRARAQASAHRG